jgi:hypothetical protein
MIYQNNYYYAGASVILYKYELDYDGLGILSLASSLGRIPTTEQWVSTKNITEIGVEYKKTSDGTWNKLLLHYGDIWGNVPVNKQDTTEYEYEDDNYILSCTRNASGLIYKEGIIQPIRVIIKNLDTDTDYDIRSYYIENRVTKYFNLCHPHTQENEGNCECTAIIGGTVEQQETLRSNCNLACQIFNSVGESFDFTYKAHIVDAYYGGDSNMNFGIEDLKYVGSVVHEMAHNIMLIVKYNPVYCNGVDTKKAKWDTYFNEMTKFMEFATHVEGAYWNWQGAHCYPIIRPYNYDKAMCYFVAAACQISRKYGSQYINE